MTVVNNRCPVCQTQASTTWDGHYVHFACARCGTWEVVGGRGDVSQWLVTLFASDPDIERIRRSNLSHILQTRFARRRSRIENLVVAEMAKWPLDEPFATPQELFDRLVLWIAEQKVAPGEMAGAKISSLSALLGLPVKPDAPHVPLAWLLKEIESTGWIEGRPGMADNLELRLTARGWSRRTELAIATSGMHAAFMAMKFHSDVRVAYLNCFRPACKDAGYSLRTVADGQPAGLIDDQLRVRLRTSRFVIADLTFSNPGAYWEAGFAEGLGRPVIYTCRREEWASEKTHFDTNHLATIIWDANNFADVQQAMTDMIRATLPAEAKLD